jgi:hypothetical protein
VCVFFDYDRNLIFKEGPIDKLVSLY